MPVVLPAKGHGVVGDVDEAMIRDGDAVGVAGQIVQHMLGAAERAVWRRRPSRGERVVAERRGRRAPPRARKAPGSDESAAPIRPGQSGDKLPAKHPAQDLDGKEERRARMYPLRPIGRQPADRDHAVHVRMVQQRLAPGVEDAEEADRRAEVFRVGRDLQQRGRARAQEEIVDDRACSAARATRGRAAA